MTVTVIDKNNRIVREEREVIKVTFDLKGDLIVDYKMEDDYNFGWFVVYKCNGETAEITP